MKNCIACGMPLTNKEDIGGELENRQQLCVHCVNEDGKAKSCQEIFKGGVDFFMSAIPGTEKELAEKITRKNMNNLPYWRERKEECLQGEEATDEEFQDALSKLKP